MKNSQCFDPGTDLFSRSVYHIIYQKVTLTWPATCISTGATKTPVSQSKNFGASLVKEDLRKTERANTEKHDHFIYDIRSVACTRVKGVYFNLNAACTALVVAL